MLGGEEYYKITSANSAEKILIYHKKEDRFTLLDYGKIKELDVMPEAKEQLLSARRDFADILSEVQKSDGSFHIAKGKHYLIAYRRERSTDVYRFLIFLGRGTVLQYLCTVEKLLDVFDFTTLSEYPLSDEKNIAAVRTGDFPLFLSAEKCDRYLYLTIKYLAGIASQEEADEATSIDGKTRFVPEEKVYGEGVTVSDVQQVSPSFFNRAEQYSCTVTIGSRPWRATWRPGQHCLRIQQYYRETSRGYINISDELYDSLQKQAAGKKIFKTPPFKL